MLNYSYCNYIVRVGEPIKNSFVTNQVANKPKKISGKSGNVPSVPNMGLVNNIQNKNTGMKRKSRLQFKRISTDKTSESDQRIHEKYGSKTSSCLGQIKEENNSQASIRADSRDPRKKSTPRVEEHKGDQGVDVDHDTQEDQKLVYYDTEVIQHLHTQYRIPIEDLFKKLQLGDSGAIELYDKWVENKKKVMKTVYPNVIHSAVSSPQNRGSAIGMFYASPDENNSNTRNSNKDIEMMGNICGLVMLVMFVVVLYFYLMFCIFRSQRKCTGYIK
jgi:hypothetical protein